MTLSAFADDVCVLIKDNHDITALVEALNKFYLASSLRCNWTKSKALWVPLIHNKSPEPALMPPGPLPENLEWEKEGVRYLGIFLGVTQYVKKKTRL